MSTLYVYIERFIQLMIDIWEKIIYIPENIDQFEDLKYIYNYEYSKFKWAKLAIDGTLIKK